MEQQIIELQKEVSNLQILIRINNLLLSRFILQLSKTRDDLHLPKRNTFFKFELLEDDYIELVNEFGKKEVDSALYRLDRMLLTNKQQCPNNIKRFIGQRLKELSKKKEKYKQEKNKNDI